MNYENPAKLERATKWAKANGKENDAEAIKAHYIALGGKVSGEEAPEEMIIEGKGEILPTGEIKSEVTKVEKIVRRRRGQK